MSAPYESHILTFTPPIMRGKGLYASLLLKLTCLFALLMASSPSSARPSEYPVVPDAGHGPEAMADSTEIHFRRSSSALDLNLDGNGERLDNLIRQIKKISGRDSTYVLTTLRVIGSASPEGTDQINRLLSERRAHVLFDYFAQHITLPDSITDFEYLGRNWSGLYHLVASDPAVPAQTEVLALLRRASTGQALSTDESNRLLYRLKRLKGGVPYAYMYEHLFPALRYSYLYVQYEKRMHREIEKLVLQTIDADEAASGDHLTQPTPPAEGGDAQIGDLQNEVDAVPGERLNLASSGKAGNFYMDIRTNMLLDIAAIPNIGAEFYLGRNLSLTAGWMYSWWSYDRRHRYWRIYGGDLDLRWWFGRKAESKPLTGHHLGIYGGVLTFDFELGGTGYMGGKPRGTLWDRCLVNSGIEYGYSLPVGRRVNIDFSIGLGYLGGKYIKYFPFDNEYYRDKEFRLNYFGPTKAEVSLVWLIGRGNSNNREGGGK